VTLHLPLHFLATDEFFQATAKHIQEEHLLAAQGAYMAFVEGHRHAEDDEHTEVMSVSTKANWKHGTCTKFEFNVAR
jgi:hypothetical protein